MVEFIVKRLVVTSVLALALTYGLFLVEHNLKFLSEDIKKNGLLEHRLFHTPFEVYVALDELDLNNLLPYFAYQFGDVLKGLFLSLVFLDLSTIGLRQVPSLASLDIIPLFLIPVNIMENIVIGALILLWPQRSQTLAKVLVIFSSFLFFLNYIVYAVVALSVCIIIVKRRISINRHSLEADKDKKQ